MAYSKEREDQAAKMNYLMGLKNSGQFGLLAEQMSSGSFGGINPYDSGTERMMDPYLSSVDNTNYDDMYDSPAPVNTPDLYAPAPAYVPPAPVAQITPASVNQGDIVASANRTPAATTYNPDGSIGTEYFSPRTVPGENKAVANIAAKTVVPSAPASASKKTKQRVNNKRAKVRTSFEDYSNQMQSNQGYTPTRNEYNGTMNDGTMSAAMSNTGADRRINDRNLPGGKAAYGFNDEILSLF